MVEFAAVFDQRCDVEIESSDQSMCEIGVTSILAMLRLSQCCVARVRTPGEI